MKTHDSLYLLDEFQNLDISNSNKSNNSNMGRTIMANKSNINTTTTTNNNTKPQSSGGGQGNIKSSNKSTMRNNGDRFDPDFSRQRNPVPANYGKYKIQNVTYIIYWS